MKDGSWFVYLGLIMLAMFTQCGMMQIDTSVQRVANAVQSLSYRSMECHCR